jgi:hypothetical protein
MFADNSDDRGITAVTEFGFVGSYCGKVYGDLWCWEDDSIEMGDAGVTNVGGCFGTR